MAKNGKARIQFVRQRKIKTADGTPPGPVYQEGQVCDVAEASAAYFVSNGDAQYVADDTPLGMPKVEAPKPPEIPKIETQQPPPPKSALQLLKETDLETMDVATLGEFAKVHAIDVGTEKAKAKLILKITEALKGRADQEEAAAKAGGGTG